MPVVWGTPCSTQILLLLHDPLIISMTMLRKNTTFLNDESFRIISMLVPGIGVERQNFLDDPRFCAACEALVIWIFFKIKLTANLDWHEILTNFEKLHDITQRSDRCLFGDLKIGKKYKNIKNIEIGKNSC